ncbi:MAG TPA: amidohydrolase family protein [Acidimicrobiales bacterium]
MDRNDERLIVVSGDSHAGVPKELWSEYLPSRFHELLPSLRADNVIYPTAISLLGDKGGLEDHPEHAAAHRDGWHGLHDPVLRMADMDREGVAAELIYLGDSRLGDMFHNVTNRDYGLDAWEAGAKGWNRWAADTFGFAMERFLVTGAIGPCVDMDATVAEIEWMADHDFTGVYLPGYLRHPDMPPMYDRYWEPFWAACEQTGIALVVHAGWGTEQGFVWPVVQGIYDVCKDAAGGSTERDDLFAHSDAVTDEPREFFDNFVNHNVDSRRPMWQLMFSGVFDRFPDLGYVPTEIRVDWIPATLDFLDKAFEAKRAELPAERTPSDYWRTNVLAGASFIRKVEVGMRHEVGVETLLFGRDYPHPESTWPHTREWLRDAFEGVPDDELRLMLGENAIRFFDLDRDRLAEIARRIGPTIQEIHAGGPVADDLIENFARRGGYLKPAEGADRISIVEGAVREDLEALATAGAAR